MLAIMVAAILSKACPAIPGAEELWKKPQIRWIMVGEIHGTREMPTTFGDLVCAAAETKRPVAVALELPQEDQARIDAFLASDGSSNAHQALQASGLWTDKFQDGRGSEAMATLLDRLRQMKRDGRIVGVTVFQPTGGSRDQTAYNAAMADRLKAIAMPQNGLILTLVGNIHAMKTTLRRPTMSIVPAAADLPADRTISLNMIGNGGTAWDCERDGCGPHHAGLDREAKRGIVMGDTDDYPISTFDGTLELGVKTSAAPPARESVP